MDSQVLDHIARLKAATYDNYDLSQVPKYLQDHTFLGGERFSFKNHEYQLDILSDTTQELYATKPAQVGATEAMLRYVAALARMIPYFSVIATWPSASDAENMVKTRLNAIISGSPDLASRVNPDLDNVQVKALGTSYIYARGTLGTTTALSIPCDLLVHDEIDRSDAFTIAQYRSRIKHSRFKLVRAFGTPTIDGIGISLLMETARREKHLTKCSHCNHYFLPDYETDVHIPGWDRSKKEIDKYNLPNIRWQEAVLLCPKCFKQPDVSPESRHWVIENPNDNYDPVGYFISPFSAPKLVPPHTLIKESTTYGSYGEFRNQALGLTTSDSNDQLTLKDIQSCLTDIPLDSSDLHYMGADMGLICHIVIGRMTLAGELLIVHRERVVVGKFEERKRELAVKYKVLITVCDAYPYTDMIMRMQAWDKNLYGGIYHRNSKLATYQITKAKEDAAAGKLPIHQANIHREHNFDNIMGLFKDNKILWRKQGDNEDDIFEKHLLDMKRKQEMDKLQGVIYVWAKSAQGNDHYHHALGYLNVACKLASTANRDISIGSSIPLMTKFAVKRHN
jgi:hypothetical protein